MRHRLGLRMKFKTIFMSDKETRIYMRQSWLIAVFRRNLIFGIFILAKFKEL